MAGPGAVLRVNGFRGGRLPPKGQIQQIRFRRNMFAADMHEPGFVSVDITTKPGLDNWRGVDQPRLSRRGAERAQRVRAEQRRRAARALRLHPERAALEAAHVAVALGRRHRRIRHQDDRRGAALGLFRRFDPQAEQRAERHRAARARALEIADAARRAAAQPTRRPENLGVGDFDLVERGYSQERTETVLRASTAGAIGKALYNELRLQWLGRPRRRLSPTSAAPAVLVLNAFNAGGAQLAGARGTSLFTLADDLDIAIGRHAIRTGLLLDAGRYRTDERRNTGGTFTFASLDDYAAARPTTFTRNIGDPRLTISQAQLGTLRPGRHPRAQEPDRSAPAFARNFRPTSAACTSRREAASRGRRSRAARRRFAPAAASSSTGSTRRPTSRACSSTARTSASRRSCSPATPTPRSAEPP